MDEPQKKTSPNPEIIPDPTDFSSEQEPAPPESAIVEDTSPLEIQLGLEEEQLTLVLPTTGRRPIENWDETWASLAKHLEKHQEFPVLNVSLLAQNQLLGGRQLQQLAELLQRHQLQLKRVRTSRRQTAIAAATAGYGVEQEPLAKLLADIPNKLEPIKPINDGSDALYVSQTIRSGVEIRHKGSIVVIGDINPGGVIIADRDIVIWGCLRGVAHAGASGDRSCRIMALQMQPTQLRIADMVARSSMQTPEHPQPEVAYLTAEGIRIASAFKFSKNYFYEEDGQNWEEMPDPLNL
ncbi:septum site-determining protein MinC [[Limnothrix rosea] IAM M-220]|uniref:septum site-determining protein MinC n=1 Tax=[Limnothrix rosea] IAM M-220 TaxID=454133 RepID=UPI000962776C|nr:septum site-determining protein MinC [[Limnothrix rosea] IAM M-220]OKH13418.1 septum site-determining protein MinC [[Limnothrix rosea] IAM M-220]